MNHISDFIGVKEKLSYQSRSLMASFILSKHGDLKMSEFLYFIGKIMAGSYTRFYGEVNGQTIMFYLLDFIKDSSTSTSECRQKIVEKYFC